MEFSFWIHKKEKFGKELTPLNIKIDNLGKNVKWVNNVGNY